MKISNISEESLIRFLNGKMNSEEIREIEKWIASSAENQELFEVCRRIWVTTSVAMPADKFDPHAAWDKVAMSIQAEGDKKAMKNNISVRRWIKASLQVAAMATLFVSAGALGYRLISRETTFSRGNKYCEIIAPRGSRSEIRLPDGSVAWINAGSKLSYREDFNRTDRVVDLEGEGYFSVTSDKARPFIVQTAHLKVKAYGTVFNVKAYPDEKTVETTLVEGIVEVEAGDKAGPEKTYTYTLKPKQNIVYNIASGIVEEKAEADSAGGTVPLNKPEAVRKVIQVKSNIKPELYTSWKDENWVIEGMPLDELARLMGRRYNSHIEIRDDALKFYKFTGTIQNETLEQVLVILSMTTPLEYTIGKGNVSWMLNRNLEKNYTRILKR